MNSLLKIVFFLFGITLMHAQKTFTVTGTVQDFHDKTVLSGARLVLGTLETTSDNNGYFKLNGVKKGTHKLLVTHPACNNFTDFINVDRDLMINVSLEHHSGDIEGVTIHANHKKGGSVLLRTLNEEEIAKSAPENLGNLLKNISGVTTLKTGNNISKPIIHGLYGTRVSILNNGVKMAEQEWGVEHAPNVDVNQFGHIDVVKGASALRYGNEVSGGVVLLEPAEIAKRDSLYGNLKFSAISNGRGGEVSTEIVKTWENQWFVKSGGSYRKLGDQYVPHHTLQNTGAEIGSFNFSIGKRSFLHGIDLSYSAIQQTFGIFKGAHLGGPQDFYQAINFGQPYFLDDFSYDIGAPRQEVTHHIAKISAYQRFAGFGRLDFQYSFQLNQRQEFDIRKGELSDVPSMDLQLTTHEATLSHLLERGKWSLESGISGRMQDNYPNPATEARRLIPDYYRYDAGAFSIFKYTINPKVDVEAGIRYDFNRFDAYKYYDRSAWDTYITLYPQFFIKESGSRVLARPVLDYHNLSGNLGVNYMLSKDFTLRFNAAKTDRAPNAAELFADGLHHSAAIMEEGDLRIGKETMFSLNFTALAKARLLKGLTVEINPYLMFSDSFINQVPTGVKTTNRGVFVVWSYQQIKAQILGIDTDVALKVSDLLSWTSSFSLLRGHDYSHDEPLILMMPAQWRNVIEWKPTSESKFYIRLENETTARQKRFPVRNQTVDFIENGMMVSREIDYSTPPPGYSIFHLGVGISPLKNINVHLKLNNIFNTEYREYLNRLRYFMPEPGRNIVATLKFKF